jgi:zinc transporter 1/2/3
MGLANAFSGGVFLSLAFGHLLPHAVDELTSLHAAGRTRLPAGLSPAACACGMAAAGYLVVFVVERILFDTEAMLHEVYHLRDMLHEVYRISRPLLPTRRCAS